MTLKARVKRATGATAHYVGGVGRGGEFEVHPAPIPTSVEIQQAESGWMLLRIDASGDPITDSWHASLQEAKEQARFEYEIEEGDWETVDAPMQ